MALFKMAGKQRKAGEQAEEVGNRHPFMTEESHETGKTGTSLEAGKNDLVQADGKQAGKRNIKRCMMKERHTEQGQAEEDEIDGNAANGWQAARRISRSG